jgi:hypothetical protein
MLPSGHGYSVMEATMKSVILSLVLLAGCQAPDRVYASAAICSEAFLPPPSEPVVVPAPEQPPVEECPVCETPPPPPLAAASSLAGFFSCVDACELIWMGACFDLEKPCGLDCGVVNPSVDFTIEDECVALGTPEHPLELVVTSQEAPPSCAEAQWIPPVCALDGTPVTVAYCCTVDGSELGQ